MVIDQLAKIIVSSKIPLGDSLTITKDFWYITNLHNTGAAFGLFEGSTTLFIVVGFIAILLIGLYFYSIEEKIEYDVVLHGFLIGGILGNIIDRIVHGYVIDFLDFRVFGYNFPVFNLADAFIVLAIILLIFRIVKEDVWG